MIKRQRILTSNNQIRNLVLFYMLMLSCIALVHASSLQQELNKMLNTLSTSSDPAVYQTQRRGVISGGSFHARTRINETNLMGFVPPEFSAGCGGIDLVWRIIFVHQQRAVQQADPGYCRQCFGLSLGLAISAMNEKAYQHIEALQEKIMHLNSTVFQLLPDGARSGEQYADASGHEEISNGCFVEYQSCQCRRYVPVIHGYRIIKPRSLSKPGDNPRHLRIRKSCWVIWCGMP